MDFSEALKRLKLGAKIHRKSWPADMRSWLELSEDKKNINFVFAGSSITSKWRCLHEDILATDWVDPAE